MTALLSRLSAVFLEPASQGAVSVAPPTVAPAVGVVAEPKGALAAAGLVALGLARDRRTPTALVAVWPPSVADDAVIAPATLAARRLTRSLRAHGADAVATGRLARVALPPEPGEAAIAAVRAQAAAAVPSVVVLAGSRGPQLDEVLADQDALLLVHRPDRDDRLVTLALDALAEHRRPVAALPLALAPLTAALATAGLCPAPSRRLLAPALEVVA